MTWKTNPGCELPPIKKPPGLEDLYKNIASEYAIKKAAFLASPSVATAQRKIDAATKFADKAQKDVNQVKKYQEAIEEYADLLDTCPCAQVWDDAATDIDQS